MINNKNRYKLLIPKIVFTLLIGIFPITMVIPFLWMLSASMKLPLDVMELPIKWIPDYFYPDNYKKIWNIGDSAVRDYEFAISYWNSTKIASINVIGSIITSTLAGYAFAKIKFRGANIVFLLYLTTMMIPTPVTMIPKFVIFNELGLLGSHLTLILPGIFTVTGTFLLRQFFITVPNELREAGIIDGANEFKIWYKIMIPIATPTIASLSMVVFLWNWNNYLEPMVYLTNSELYTIPVALTNFIQETSTEYNLMVAAAASAILPAIIVFLLGQKFFVKGLVSGSVKG